MSTHETSRRQFLAAGLAVGTATILPQTARAAEPAKPAGEPAAKPAAATPGEGRLTFHAIDTHHGSTVGTLRVDLARLEGGQYKPVKSFRTVRNGRSDGAVIQGADLLPGEYEATLHVEEYFAALGTKLPTPNFLAQVPLRFGIADAGQRYHLAVLFSPWSYSYYRGS